MKPILFSLILILAISATSAFWLLRQEQERVRIKNLNHIIEEQYEQLYRKRVEARGFWVEKNLAWNELNRIRGQHDK